MNKLALGVRDRLEQLGCDPIEGLARIAADKKTAPEVRVKCYSELAQYCYPKRKSVEHSGPGGGPIETTYVSGTELLASRITGIAARVGARGGDSKSQ